MTTNPIASRRPDVEARPVRLADGNAWGLSLPSRRFKPIFNGIAKPDQPPEIEIVVEHSLDVRRRLDDLRDAIESGTEIDRFETFLGLASALLREGHEIDHQTAATLLDVAEDDFPRLILDVISVATGETSPTDSSRAESERP